MLLLLVACVSNLPTRNGEWVVAATDTPWVATRGPGATSPVLAGSTVCISPMSALRGLPPMSCADLLFNGSGLVGDCFVVPPSAPATLTVTPSTRCGGTLPQPDSLEFSIAAAGGLVGDFAFWVEEAVEAGVRLGTVRADYPSDWRPTAGAAIPVAPGGRLLVAARLRDPEGGAVAWGSRSAAVVDETGRAVSERDGSAALAAEAHTYRLEAGGGSFPLGSTEPGAPVPNTLAAVVAHAFDPAVAAERPMGARAVVRDAGGRVVFGSAVEWEFDGPLLGVVDPWDAGRVLFYASCSTRGGPQVGKLSVRVDGHTVEQELRWPEPVRKGAARARPAGCKGERGGVRAEGGEELSLLLERLGALVAHP